MLDLNEYLQNVDISAYVKFNKVSYSQLGGIFRLLIKRYNAKNFIKNHSNIFIQGTKSINKRVIWVQALEQWHRLKV